MRCLWDDLRQCLHDKVADTIVVCEALPPTHSTSTSAYPTVGL